MRSATIVALGDVVEIITQYWDRDTAVPERLVAGEHIDEGDLRVRRWGMTDDDLVPPTFNRWFQSGDVLLHSRNIKKIARPDFRGITGEKLFILRSKDESVFLQGLLPFILQTAMFQSYAESRWAGSTNKFLNKTPLEEFEFMLPPIEEQRRMSRALSAAAENRERARAVVVMAEQCHRAIRCALFFVGADRKPPSPEALPKRWCIKSISEVAEFLDGRRVPLRESDRAMRPGPYPYYGASGVIDSIDGFIFDEPLVLLSEDGANLLDRSGPIAFEAQGRYWVNNHAHVLRVRAPLTNQYLIEYLESLSLGEWVSGTAQPKLNKAAAERIPVPMGSASDIQRASGVLASSRDSILAATKRLGEAEQFASKLLSSCLASYGD